MPASLLVELLTEELPPKSLKRLSESLAASLDEGLKGLGFLAAGSEARPYATPRRLAVLITQVLDQQPDRVVERKGPSVSAGLDASGQPTPALAGFARSCGVDVSKLTREKGDKAQPGHPGPAPLASVPSAKGEYFVHRFKQKGEPLKTHLAGLVEGALKKLPVAKIMRWGAGEAQFVRPVHGVILLHGNKVVPGTVLGLKSGNRTLGHRFLSKGPITVTHADKYADILRKSGKVVASFEERREAIGKALTQAAARQKAHVFPPSSWADAADDAETMQRLLAARSILGANQELLDEVTAIVEWPAAYTGEFEREFLKVPAQCISLTMQKNQKYFALMNERAELLPTYLLVSNLETRDPANIVHGNARVLRARLADAKFFFEQDHKARLAERVPRLASVVYHNKLGSQLERVQRIQKLAVAIGQRLGADQALVERAAYLGKADLLTEMVGEFPELQGTMGYYYALHDGEPEPVARAIVRHYLPRHAGDALPSSPLEQALALADKLDTLVGIYGIGLVPSGDKDPFGLRRAALGTARILVEKALPLDVTELLQLARSQFPNGVVAESVAQDLYGFLLDRLRPYFRERGYRPDEIEAVLALNPTRLDLALKRLEALQNFRRLPEAEALAAANKRIRNILRQAGGAPREPVDAALLREQAERELAEEVAARRVEVEPLFARGDYSDALKRLASLRGAVDSFFDQVMVMAEDEALKRNRLALLNNLSELFLGAADISRLQS
jgi:glycyl-tRNA synthetase beta chain